MAKEKDDVWICDACHIRRAGFEKGMPAFGFHGTVVRTTELSGSETMEWYACSEVCIGKAVAAVVFSDDGGTV